MPAQCSDYDYTDEEQTQSLLLSQDQVPPQHDALASGSKRDAPWPQDVTYTLRAY